MSNLDILRQARLFVGLSDAELEKIATGLHEQSVQIGSVIIEENDPPKEALYIVKEGEIAISTGQSDNPEEVMLTTMGPGDAFGEISLIDDSPHSATVRAMSDATILCLSSAFFSNIMDSDRNIGYFVMRNLAKMICDRLRATNFTIKHFGFYGKPEDMPA